MCGIDFEKEFYFNNYYATNASTNVLFVFNNMCLAYTADSHVNRDLKIQHLDKVVSRGVNKTIMEHLVKFYRENALGYRLFAYDGHKSLCTIGLLPFPSKEFQISLLREDDSSNTQRFLNQIPQK